MGVFKTSDTSLASKLPTDCDRIVGVKFTMDSHERMSVLAMYLSSSSHTFDEFRETLDLLWALCEYYCDQGTTLILGDFNGTLSCLGGDRISSEPNALILGDFNGTLSCLGGDRISSEPSARGELINEFLNYFNLLAVNLDNICSDPLDTFYSGNRLSSSDIDLIVVPRSLLQYIYINCSYEFEKDCENFSDNLPVDNSFKISTLRHCDSNGPISNYTRKRVSWHKLSPNKISSLYTLPLDEKLKDFNCDIEMETCFQKLNKIIWETFRGKFECHLQQQKLPKN